jgi:CBS domain-containing protein
MKESVMQEPSPPRAAATGTVADVMHPALTTVEQDGHMAAAAYLMKRAHATALVVIDDEDTQRPIGLISEADFVKAVADGNDADTVRVHDLMTREPAVIAATTTVRDAAETMLSGNFRHLVITDEGRLTGILDIQDVCRALLDLPTG